MLKGEEAVGVRGEAGPGAGQALKGPGMRSSEDPSGGSDLGKYVIGLSETGPTFLKPLWLEGDKNIPLKLPFPTACGGEAALLA